MGGGKDFFAGYGVHTIALQIPIAGLKAKNRTIGVWASVERKKVTTRGQKTSDRGSWVQVNRLGEPARQRGRHPDRAQGPLERAPAVERGRQFKKYYETPILAAVINKLYKLGVPETGPRRPGRRAPDGRPEAQLHRHRSSADMLRLNLGIPVGGESEPARRARWRHRRAGRTAVGSATT